MKKLFILILLLPVIGLYSQSFYTFSHSNQTYTRLSGATTIINRAWTDFEKAVPLPFPFKFFSTPLADSLYIDDWGTINIDDSYYGDISFIWDDLNSRGMDKSEVSYKVEGATPNRIFKLQFNNAGLDVDSPMFRDSLNVQAWLYETSNIIEFRFGSGAVNANNWFGAGPYVALFDPVDTNKFIIIEGNTANPTVNTTDYWNSVELNGLPASGTVYRFTPSPGTGIKPEVQKIRIVENRILLSNDQEITGIEIVNCNGKIVQSVRRADEVDLSNLPHGMYLINIHSEKGTITEKLIR